MNLASIAERLGGDTFLTQTLHRDYQYMPGALGDLAPALIAWDDLNTILAEHRLEPPRLRLSAGGEMVPVHRYTQPVVTRRNTVWNRLLPAELHARLAEGASLVLDVVDELHPPVAQLASELEEWLHTGMQANLYASWTGQEGFGTHWDDHGVLVFQLDGAKRWRIYGPTREMPMYRDVAAPEEPPTIPIADIVLRAGDVLYLPRGWWHSVAASEGVHSLHLSFGIQAHTGADLLTWVADQLRTHTQVRSDLPRQQTAEEQEDYVRQLRKLVNDTLDEPGLIGRYSRARDDIDPGRGRPSLPYVDTTPPESVQLQLTAPRARLCEQDDEVVLTAAGTQWNFAPSARPLLDLLMGGTALPLTELASRSGLPEDQVRALAHELVAGQVAAYRQDVP